MSIPANPFFATPAQRIALARERFFEQGQRPLGLVSEPIIQSWARCLSVGHRPHETPVFDPVSRARMRATVERNRALLRAAGPEIDQLDAMLAGTACKTVLTDRHGVVVRATPGGLGAGEVLDALGRPGVDLQERHVGSTAPGISATAESWVTVSGAEHFFGVLQAVHCAAAPIRNGQGQLVGVLDLSIQGAGFAFDALSIVRLSAAAIENRLLATQAAGQLLLRFQSSPRLFGTPLEGLAAVDEHGRLCWVNPAGQTLLQRPADDAGERFVEPLLGLTLDGLLRLTRQHQPLPHRLPSGLQIWLQVSLADAARSAEVVPEDGAEPPVVAAAAPATRATEAAEEVAVAAVQAGGPGVSLRALSQQVIESTLQRCGGNISAAARALGVSRGLLYRRLKQGR